MIIHLGKTALIQFSSQTLALRSVNSKNITFYRLY